jgi:hypothetical protein
MNTYEWNIAQLECKPQEDGKTDVVVTAHWTVSATDGTNTTSAYGSQSFTLNQEGSFTPFADLTETQVIGWVQESMGIDAVTSLQENLDKQITDLANPPIVRPPLPWSTEPV